MDAAPIELMPVTAVEAITRGEVDMQVSTAKRYPRNLEKSKNAAIAMATVDQETAGECMYALPRAGKKIEGGSVRLAEIVFSTYGNIRAQARIIDDPADKRHVTAMASAWDLESNAAASIEKKRRCTDKKGTRYGDDMIINTQNANASIAFRDAVFKVIPRAFWWPVYEAARNVAIGTAATIGERRTKLVKYFAKMGIFEERLLANLGYKQTDQIDLEDIEKLLGTANLIRDGHISPDEAFPPLDEPDKETTTLADRLKAKRDNGATQPPAPIEPESDTPTKSAPASETGEPEIRERAHLVSEIKDMAKTTGEGTKIEIMGRHGVKILGMVKSVEKLKAIALDMHEAVDEATGNKLK
jgi:hypothetical protein